MRENIYIRSLVFLHDISRSGIQLHSTATLLIFCKAKQNKLLKGKNVNQIKSTPKKDNIFHTLLCGGGKLEKNQYSDNNITKDRKNTTLKSNRNKITTCISLNST